MDNIEATSSEQVTEQAAPSVIDQVRANQQIGVDTPVDTPSQETVANPFQPIVEATGGRITSAEDLQSFITRADQADQYKSQLEAAQQIEKVSFANPMVEQINGLYAAGAKPSEIQAFIKVQSLDIDSLDPASAVREQFKLQYPDLTREEVDALLVDEYGGEEGDFSSLSAVNKAKLSRAASDARTFLREKRVAVSQPESVRDSMRQTQELEQRQTQWGNSVSQFIGSYDKISVNTATKAGETNLYDFNVPKDNQAAIRDVVTNYMMNSNVNPNTPEAQSQIQDLTNKMVYFFHGEELLNNAIRHATANTAEQIQAAESGIIPTNRNVVPPQVVQSTGGGGRGARTLDEIRQSRLGRR